MDTAVLTTIASFLGLCLSIFVFVLTRWERRKKLVVEIRKTSAFQYYKKSAADEYDDSELIIVRATNMGSQPMLIDTERLALEGNGKTVDAYNTDWFDIEKIPAPLAPQQNFEVVIYQSAFEDLLGVKEFEKYMNVDDYRKCVIPVTAVVKELHGKAYRSKGYNYNFYVSEFERDIK